MLKKLGFVITATAMTLFAVAAQAATTNATIYVGHDGSFGGSATNSSALQGYTDIIDRWNGAGANAVISSTFSTADQDLIVISNPTSAMSAGELAQLQAFLGTGGTLVLAHDGAVGELNSVSAGIGSALTFGAIQGGGEVTGQVVNAAHPLMTGLSNGDAFSAFSPGQITGGTSLVDIPLGTSIISVESLLGGLVVGVADFDILNNVSRSYFSGQAQASIFQFQDNLIGDQTMNGVVPLPASLPLLGFGVGLFALLKRRRTATA